MLRDRLSDTKIRQAKPRPKAYKLTDGGGLFVLVHPNGSRYWRLKYRSNGKEKLFAIGVYPEISLAQARGKALEARQLIRDGVDPVVERRRRRSEAGSDSASFQVIAEEWIATRANEWAPTYREAVRSALAASLPTDRRLPRSNDHGAGHARGPPADAAEGCARCAAEGTDVGLARL